MSQEPPIDPDDDPSAEPPVLSYHAPGRDLFPLRSRNDEIRTGCMTVWAALFACIAVGCGTRFAGLLPALGIAAACLIAAAVKRQKENGHSGYLVGLLLGLLTFVGVGALLIVVVCGNMRF